MTHSQDDTPADPRLRGLEERFRSAALAYPGAYEESPWGERVVKVNGKIFLFVGIHKGQLTFTVKLPMSAAMALQLAFTSPTGYGLGKSGWVTSVFAPSAKVPEVMLLDWLDESYRALAPKKLVKTLSATAQPAEPKKQALKAEATKAVATKVAAKKGVTKGSRRLVLVIGEDPLRRKRCAEALEERGYRVEQSDASPAVLDRAGAKPALIVVDIGRRSQICQELVEHLSDTPLGKIPMCIAGVRTSSIEQQLRKLPAVKNCFKQAPGDEVVVERIVAQLS